MDFRGATKECFTETTHFNGTKCLNLLYLLYVVFNDANGTLGPIFTTKKTTQFLNGTS